MFTAVFKAVPAHQGGGFVGYVPELRAITQGETLEETRENLQDAIQLVLQANAELNRNDRW